MAKFVLREDQYNALVSEGIIPDKVIKYNGKDPNTPAQIRKDIEDQPDNSKQSIEIEKGNSESGNYSTTVWENRLISKKELKENRLKKLRENSEIISVKDIFGL